MSLLSPRVYRSSSPARAGTLLDTSLASSIGTLSPSLPSGSIAYVQSPRLTGGIPASQVAAQVMQGLQGLPASWTGYAPAPTIARPASVSSPVGTTITTGPLVTTSPLAPIATSIVAAPGVATGYYCTVTGRALKCTACDTPLGPGQKFCHNCGKKVEPQRICSNCGAVVPENFNFCGKCGWKYGNVSPRKEMEDSSAYLTTLPDPGNETYLTKAVDAGNNFLMVAGGSNFKVGQQMLIDPGSAKEEVNRIAQTGSVVITLSHPLNFSHRAGTEVIIGEELEEPASGDGEETVFKWLKVRMDTHHPASPQTPRSPGK